MIDIVVDFDPVSNNYTATINNDLSCIGTGSTNITAIGMAVLLFQQHNPSLKLAYTVAALKASQQAIK